MYVPEGSGRSFVLGVGENLSYGKWWATEPSTDFVGAHEAGHFMGLNDHYDPETNLPHEGWEKNIMGVFNGVVDERNIEDILRWWQTFSADYEKIKQINKRAAEYLMTSD